MLTLKGSAVSPGMARGKAFIYKAEVLRETKQNEEDAGPLHADQHERIKSAMSDVRHGLETDARDMSSVLDNDSGGSTACRPNQCIGARVRGAGQCSCPSRRRYSGRYPPPLRETQETQGGLRYLPFPEGGGMSCREKAMEIRGLSQCRRGLRS